MGEKVHPKQNTGYVYEKRAPALRWYGDLRMVNPALSSLSVCTISNIQWVRQIWFQTTKSSQPTTKRLKFLKNPLQYCIYTYTQTHRMICWHTHSHTVRSDTKLPPAASDAHHFANNISPVYRTQRINEITNTSCSARKQFYSIRVYHLFFVCFHLHKLYVCFRKSELFIYYCTDADRMRNGSCKNTSNYQPFLIFLSQRRDINQACHSCAF